MHKNRQRAVAFDDATQPHAIGWDHMKRDHICLAI